MSLDMFYPEAGFSDTSGNIKLTYFSMEFGHIVFPCIRGPIGLLKSIHVDVKLVSPVQWHNVMMKIICQACLSALSAYCFRVHTASCVVS